MRGIHAFSAGKGDGREARESFLAGARTWVFLSGGTLASPHCLHPADPTQPRLAGKRNFRLSVFANQLPSPAKRQNRLLLITKKYYPLAGGSQQHEYPKQTDTVCLEAWCLVQLPCQIQAHRSSYSRSERGRRGWFVICMLQHRNSNFIFTSWLPKLIGRQNARVTLLHFLSKFATFSEVRRTNFLQHRRNLIARALEKLPNTRRDSRWLCGRLWVFKHA